MMFWYYWALKAIAGGIIGSAFANWFQGTKIGIWFFKKVENIMHWAAERYNLEILKTESRFAKKYPTIMERLEKLEKKVK